MKTFIIGLAALAACVFSSCNGGGITCSGAAFDLVVVGDDNVWNSQGGQTIDSVFGGSMPALPESEPYFKVIHIKPSLFDGIVKPARNVLIYDVDPQKYSKGTVRYQKDVWALYQAVVRITAPSDSILTKTVRENSTRMLRFLTNAEADRALNYYSSYRNIDYSNHVYNKFGITMVVPADINRMRDTTNFLWMANNNLNCSKNMVIFTSPYKSQSDFSAEHLVAVQDSFTTQFISGPSEGSVLHAERRVPFAFESLKPNDGDYCAEVRGMWRCSKDYMGGPFVSRNYLSADHKNIITVMVYMYAPKLDKRNALRMLEAAAGSVKVKPNSGNTNSGK